VGGSALVSSGWAWEPQKALVHTFGPLTLRPQLAVAEQFNDNVLYQRRAAAEADFLTLISPGLNLELGWEDRQININLDYLFSQSLFANRSDLNAGNHTFAMVTAIDTDRLKVTGRDQFSYLTDVLGGTTALYRNVERLLFSDSWRAEYFLSEKTGAILGGQFNATDYDIGTPLYDYNTWRINTGFGYRPGKKSFFFGEVYYGQSATTPNFAAPKGPHLTFMGGYVGVRGNFSPRITGYVKGGYEVREFSDDTPVPGAPVVDLSLDYKFSEKRLATFAYRRATGVSVERPTESYTLDGLNLSLTQYVGSQRRWLATFGGGLNFYNYDAAKVYAGRSDLTYQLQLGTKYLIRRWFAAGLDYEFEGYASSYQGIIDYTVNRITLSFSLGY
jgi:hypothetical protein